jgi:hypothetical protein
MPEVEVVRRIGNFPPSLWGDRFASFSIDKKVMESYEEQIEVLKETVTNMLMANFTSDSLGNVRFIDLLCNLGVSYHFETKIEKQLAKAFEDYTTIVDNVGFDLYTVALWFRVFRQHGYPMPSDVFEKFRDSDGKFMEELSRDAKGMLSLYEASQLAMHGEEILDDALAFTKRHLESLATQSSSHLAKHITSSLYRPLHKCIPRLAARQFISFYEGEESKSEILLKFAKIDYNRLQLLYKEELCQLTRWYRNLDITSNLTYARDRIVEIYLCWGFGAYFEPQFSKTRRIITKFIEIVSVLDDTYDLYGTIEELQIFTDAIQRMDLNAVDELPEYMKYLYRLLLNMFDECDQELIKEGFSYNTSYTRDAFKELARGCLVEEEWCRKKHVPTVDEYVRNGLITSAYTAVVMSSFLGMGELIADDAKAFEWSKTLPKIHVASQELGRLINDIVSHEAEQKRGHVASFIECYMKEYGVAKKEAVEACDKRIDDAWKNINEDFMKETSVPNVVLMRSVNLARGFEVAYRYDDGYTNPIESLRFHVETLLIQPIPI